MRFKCAIVLSIKINLSFFHENLMNAQDCAVQTLHFRRVDDDDHELCESQLTTPTQVIIKTGESSGNCARGTS